MPSSPRAPEPAGPPAPAAGRGWPPWIAGVLGVSLVAYAVMGVTGGGGWLSAAAAGVVAALLWRRHARARFAAYVFLTVVAVRALALDAWPALAFSLGALALLQTPPALRAWPRLRPGRRCYNGGS